MTAEALEHYEKALDINRDVYGDGHSKVAINKNNIANIQRSRGNVAEAKKYYKEAIKVLNRTLGSNHDTTKLAMRNYRRLSAQKERNERD